MSERNASVGYAALKKETTAGTAVTPTVYVPYYEQSMTTIFNVIEDEPIVGNLWGRYQTLQGIRGHTGSITVMAEPNTMGYWFDMLSTKTATSGAGPYTHTFDASTATAPNSYTLDISYGAYVVRFAGVQASKIDITFDGELMKLVIDLSALSSFYGRNVSSTTTTTVNLSTEYDPSPTTGLVASDNIWIHTALGTTPLSTTVASITDGDTFVAGATAAAYNTDGFVRLRPGTPSYTLQEPFTWGKTRFFFAADATTAETNAGTVANQTRLDPGTTLSISFPFENAEGEKRSGLLDPAALLRTVYDAEFKIKVFLDTPEQIKYWNALTKRAVWMVATTGSTSQYKLQVSLSNMKARTNDTPSETKGTIYHEIDYAPNYDTSDARGFEVDVINAVATI